MGPLLGRVGSLAEEFRKNLKGELAGNALIQKELGKCGTLGKAAARLSAPLASLAGGIFRPVPTLEPKENNGLREAAGWIRSALAIPQYYGGPPLERRPESPCWLSRLLGGLSRRLASKWRVWNDFRVLRRIENETVPTIMRELFDFSSIPQATQEGLESLKRLRSAILGDPGQFGLAGPVRLILSDLRRVEAERVEVKGLRKRVKVKGEITVRVVGKRISDGRTAGVDRHYGVGYEFVRSDDSDDWVCDTFSYEEFS